MRAKFVAPIALTLHFVACRQVLGIEDLPDQARTDAAIAPSSPFTITNRVPSGETLTGAWGMPGYLVAVGTRTVSYFYENGLVERLGGNAAGRDFTAVSGRSKNDLYASGKTASGGFVSHYDGTRWVVIFETDTALHGIWCIPEFAGAVLAVGDNGKVFGLAPGETWSLVSVLPKAVTETDVAEAPVLWAISGRSLDDFAIAGGSQIFHREPIFGGFAHYRPVGRGDVAFRSVWQLPGPTTNVILGTNYSGAAWFTSSDGTDVDASADGGFTYSVSEITRNETEVGADKRFTTGVWGNSERIVGVDDHGRIRTEDQGTLNIRKVPSPTDEPLFGVWGNSTDDVWIVGSHELILHGSIR